jgi:hypothetical protein
MVQFRAPSNLGGLTWLSKREILVKNTPLRWNVKVQFKEGSDAISVK